MIHDAEGFLKLVQGGTVPLRDVCQDAHTHLHVCARGPLHCEACVYAVALFHVLEAAGQQVLAKIADELAIPGNPERN